MIRYSVASKAGIALVSLVIGLLLGARLVMGAAPTCAHVVAQAPQ